MTTFTFSYSAPDANGVITVSVTKTNSNPAETLTLTSLGGTATSGTDYTSSLGVGGTLQFNGNAPQTLTFTIDLAQDNITEGTETIILNFSSNRSGLVLSGNTLNVTDTMECFMPGTMILTPSGEVAVETLKIGDLVLTADGKAEAIRWMGRQTVSTRFGDKLTKLPIRIKAGALDENVPVRDLLVSPGHAMRVDGVLAQAATLINGTSIVQEFDVPEIFTYHHIELASHSLVIAEGAEAETFVDNVERARFDNYAEYQELYPDAAPIAELDLPLAKSMRQVPMSTRRRLAQRGQALYGKDFAKVG